MAASAGNGGADGGDASNGVGESIENLLTVANLAKQL